MHLVVDLFIIDFKYTVYKFRLTGKVNEHMLVMLCFPLMTVQRQYLHFLSFM